jgi:hypothetical protein
MMPYVKQLLCQSSDETVTIDDAVQGLMALFGEQAGTVAA